MTKKRLARLAVLAVVTAGVMAALKRGNRKAVVAASQSYPPVPEAEPATGTQAAETPQTAEGAQPPEASAEPLADGVWTVHDENGVRPRQDEVLITENAWETSNIPAPAV